MNAVSERNGDRIPTDDEIHQWNLMHELPELGTAKVHVVRLEPVLAHK
jgi:hypothetical protein